MKIELKKEVSITGKVSFKLYLDNWCEAAYTHEQTAVIAYENAVEKAKQGYPKNETYLSIEI